MKSTIFVIENAQDIQSLLDAWEGAPEQASALVVGDAQLAATAAGIFGDICLIDASGKLAESYAESAAALVCDQDLQLVLGAARPASRGIIGKVAVRKGAAFVSGVTAISAGGSMAKVTRSVYDDFIEVDEASWPVCGLLDSMAACGDAPAGQGSATVEAIQAEANECLVSLGVSEVAASEVETARYVVGVGFGAHAPEAFQAAQDLAQVLDAKIGPSMNIVENTTLMPGARYIGISGIRIAPKLYVALGISGAIQHLVGIRNAETVVVVNKDPKAKFFYHANYGIVGKVEEIAPALVRALEA